VQACQVAACPGLEPLSVQLAARHVVIDFEERLAACVVDQASSAECDV